MGLSLGHVTVNPASGNYAPNLLLNGWFTLHWFVDDGLRLIQPTNMSNGQEFIIDIVRHVPTPSPETWAELTWDDIYYRGQMMADASIYGLWGGSGPAIIPARRHHFLVLDGVCSLISSSVCNPLGP